MNSGCIVEIISVKQQQMTASKKRSYSAKGCSFKKKVLFIAYILIREMMLINNPTDR